MEDSQEIQEQPNEAQNEDSEDSYTDIQNTIVIK